MINLSSHSFRTLQRVAIIILITICGTLPAREFADQSGRKLEAEMVSVTPAGAVVKKPDGTKVTIPLSRLSEADRAWVLEWAERQITDAFEVRATMKKVANGPSNKNMTRTDGGTYKVRVKSSAWTEDWRYDLRLVNK